MIHVTNSAFEKLVVELDYPMSHWGSEATEECLNYTSILLEMLNSIKSSASLLNQARSSSLSKLSPIKIPINFPRILNPVKIERSAGSKEKERVILEALMLRKKIGLLALGIALSGLCSDVEPYMDVREYAGGFNDPETKALDSEFITEMKEAQGFVKEVKVVSDAIVPRESFKDCANEVKERFEALQGSVNAIEKNADELFSAVLASKNELMDHLRTAIN